MTEKTVERKNFVLTRKCQVDGVLQDPKGRGAFINNLPVTQIEPCPECIETPGKNTVCVRCKGEGRVMLMRGGQLESVKCTTCDGTGKNENQKCPYCKGTKRSYPPHHYQEVDAYGDAVFDDEQDQADADAKKEADAKKQEADKEKIKELRKTLRSMGRDFVSTWGVQKLEEAIILAKKQGA